MPRGNVLVIGDSGVGKSTLINAVMGERVARTSYGTSGTTKHLELYQNEEIDFRMIDTVGFEPSFIKRMQAVNSVRKWAKAAAKAGDPNSAINVVWFCVDGTARKLFPETIKALISATKFWKNVPVIVVITKSYSEPDRAENIDMVMSAFRQSRQRVNLYSVIPVVAEIFKLNDDSFAPQEGLTELIEATNNAMPAGIKAAGDVIEDYKLQRKRTFAHGLVATATTAGAIVGASPIPIADAVVLSGIEMGEVKGLASIYGMPKNEKTGSLVAKIVEIGTVSSVARATLSAVLKAFPGAGNVAYAAVAGSFVAAIGEASIFVYEQLMIGNKTADDIEWVEDVISEKLSKGFVEKVKAVVDALNDKSSSEDVMKAIMKVFK